MFAITSVLEFPPIESFSRFVSLLCLYGMNSRVLSHDATTTISKNDNDLLMKFASLRMTPSEPWHITRGLTGLFGAFGAGEVDEVELGVDDLFAGLDAGLALNVEREDAMRPRRCLVQLML
jgi:hypothetical protein